MSATSLSPYLRKICMCMMAATAWSAASIANAQLQSPTCVAGANNFADYDSDGDVDLADGAAFVGCLGGPGESPAPVFPYTSDACLAVFDFDIDNDTDLYDAAQFGIEFTGPCQSPSRCPDGYTRRHTSGLTDNPDIDTFEPSDYSTYDYICVPDATCDNVTCSGQGTCHIIDGQPTCACDPGYAGYDCELCATGYELSVDNLCVLGDECRQRLCSGQGDCVDSGGDIVCLCDYGATGPNCADGIPVGLDPATLRPPTFVEVEGADASVARGDTRRLTVTPYGGGNIDTDFVWTLYGPGQLDTTSGSVVTYTAPVDDGSIDTVIVRVDVAPAAFPQQVATRYLTIDPAGGIASMGNSHPTFKPIDDAVRDFMWHRCVGGAIVGVSFFGKVVHVKGFGNMSGAATNDPDFLDRCGDTFDVSNLVPGQPLPTPEPVKANTPFRLGSCSKPIAAAVLRKVIYDSGLLGPDPTDADIESARVCEALWDLLPDDVYDILCDGDTPPLNWTTNGIDDTFCPDPSVAADSRWADLRIGHLLGHWSGLQRDAPSTKDVINPSIGAIRDLNSLSDWAQQTTELSSECGFPAGCFGSEFPDFATALADIGQGAGAGYFVPQISPNEALKVMGGSCLQWPPGLNPADFDIEDSYSNEAYHMIGAIIEHVAGHTFAGRVGRPGLHSGSPLEDFLIDELGVPIPGQSTTQGILKSQGVLRLRGKEPVYRIWNAQEERYYNLNTDPKRPHCVWDGNDCDFTDWKEANPSYNWDFDGEYALSGFDGGARIWSGAGGGLAAEAEVMLRFMSKYWIGGSGSNPRYGETRCPDGDCVWTRFTTHNGSLGSAYAYTIQLGGMVDTGNACTNGIDCKPGELCRGGTCKAPNEYSMPRIDPCTQTYVENWRKLSTKKCRFPAGVDIFVAVNQRTDKICRDAEALSEGNPDYFECRDAYGMLDNFMYDAACEIQWPVNPYIFWPPVTPNGGSGMTVAAPLLASVFDAPSFGLQGQAPCCGDGVKDPGQACDGTDFGGKSCAWYGYEMGDLICSDDCGTIITSGCSGGVSILPPASYADCGYDLEDCDDHPGGCDADGSCLGGPCARTNPSDYDGALFDPFNMQSEFHPDGDFIDEQGNLYYCRDDTSEGEMVCVNENGWGVCKKCEPGPGSLSTGIGCSCQDEDDCDVLDISLGCYGEEFGGGPGFCWDEQDGPPIWQCAEGTCGMAPWYGDDNMYCEHYSESGVAHCEPWYACNPILSRICAGQALICEENALGCTNDDCCTAQCVTDDDCTPAYGWPAGYSCENTNQGLRCVGP